LEAVRPQKIPFRPADGSERSFERRFSDNLREAKDLLTNIRRFPEFCWRYIKIRPVEGGKTVRFELNEVQWYFFWKFIVPLWEAGLPIRIVILKMRQSGFSTLIEAFTIWCTLGHKNWESLVIGKDKDQARRLFRMMKQFVKGMPVPVQAGESVGEDEKEHRILPYFPLSGDSKDSLEFNRPKANTSTKKHGIQPRVYLDSRVDILYGSQEEEIGQGGTFQTVHASEAAFWPSLVSSLTKLNACCHQAPRTSMFIETTANGMNEFYTFWFNDVLGEEEIVQSNWKKAFIPWYWHTPYEKSIVGRKHLEFLDEEEEALFRRIMEDKELPIIIGERVTENRAWRKLLWRRWAIHDISFKDKDKFREDYPSTATEAFVFSGNQVFKPSHIARLESMCKDPVRRCEIVLGERSRTTLIPATVDVKEYGQGRMLIYEEPEPAGQYVIFADVAEGKASEAEGSKSKYDFNCAQILRADVLPLRQVAIWHGSIDPDELGYSLVGMAKFFMKAFLAWEVNGPGRVIKSQVCNHMRYSNIYLRTDDSTLAEKPSMIPGFLTTLRTKPEMVSVAIGFVRDGMLEIRDQATVAEMKVFSRIGENRYGAASGHDDRVMALCGALKIIEPRIGYFARRARAEKDRIEEEKKSQGADAKSRPDDEEYHPILGTEF
jgi:hypothetical protein